METLEARALGQLLFLQSVVAQLPNKEGMLQFTVRGLENLPGLRGVWFQLPDGPVPRGASSDLTLPVSHRGLCHATLHFSVADEGRFSTYLPYLKNLVAMVGLILSERLQRDENLRYRSQLEDLVVARTEALVDAMALRHRMETRAAPDQRMESPGRPGGPASEPPGRSSTDRPQVLLVDDDLMVRRYVEALLGRLGYRVAAADCGEAALSMLGEGCRPDLVILDLNMPGLGGAGTLPRLRERLPGVPVILATGRPDQSAQDLVAGYPGVTLLAKPFNLDGLRKVLEVRTV